MHARVIFYFLFLLSIFRKGKSIDAEKNENDELTHTQNSKFVKFNRLNPNLTSPARVKFRYFPVLSLFASWWLNIYLHCNAMIFVYHR